MRKIRDVLNCVLGKSLSTRNTARITGAAHTTVVNYLTRFNATGLKWPLPEEVDDEQLEYLLFPQEQVRKQKDCLIDFDQVHEQLKEKGATLKVLHEEWTYADPIRNTLSYSQFVRNYSKYVKSLRLSMRMTHVYGQQGFVDYSGKRMYLNNRKNGERIPVEIFVGVLGASQYSFCEATMTQSLPDFIGSHIRMYEHFGGVPLLTVPDNLKSAVTKASRFEPIINESYRAMCRHYGTEPFPARPRKPKDKPLVEIGVKLVQTWVLFRLRKRVFYTLKELNDAITELMVELNAKKFQKQAGSRFERWITKERPALQPLPLLRYEFAELGKARVRDDYHVCIEDHFYSVPHQYRGQQIDFRATSSRIEITLKGKCIAGHVRSRESKGTTTLKEHRPETHQAIDFSLEDALIWANGIGPQTAALVEKLLTSVNNSVFMYKTFQAIKSIEKGETSERLEEACTYAIKNNIYKTGHLRRILTLNIDRILGVDVPDGPADLVHENIRGAEYYNQLLNTTEGNDDDSEHN